MSKRRFPLWTLLALVLVVALVVGSGILSSGPPTKAERARAIESVLRCPSCEDLSVADSTAQTAVAVRATVNQLLSEGRTDQQIEAYLEARYGSSIVLDPPARGWPLLVWLLPLAGGLVAVGALGLLFHRRRSGTGPTADPVVADHGPGRRQLEERRQFLVRSLADADAEYLAGDLSDGDYLSLRQRDLVHLATVEAQLDGAAAHLPTARASVTGPAPDVSTVATRLDGEDQPGLDRLTGGPAPGVDDQLAAERAEPASGRPAPSRRHRWLLRGAAASFAAALIVAVSLFASNRLPGQTETGSVSVTQSQRIQQTLDQAASLENQGQLGPAAQLYQSVLAGHPDNEVALAQLGWLEYQTGRSGNSPALVRDGEAKLDRAARIDPGDYAASLYLGTILLRDGNAAGAVGQYQRFLGDNPPSAVVQQATPELRQAFQQAGVPVPAELAGG